jgi:hypothetical protein
MAWTNMRQTIEGDPGELHNPNIHNAMQLQMAALYLRG